MANLLNQLSSIYPSIKGAVVAICLKVSKRPEFPPILGSGFIVREDGLIFTCDHVVKAIEKLVGIGGLPRQEWPAEVMLFQNIPGKGMGIVPMEIKGVILTQLFKPKGGWYGEDIPDIGIIRADFKGLPTMKMASEVVINEGDMVAVSGFPMGENVLIAPGWLHQITPTLQTGVVSAILPFPCPSPHAFLLDVMCKGGSSGSPVFNIETGEVLGMVYGGLPEKKIMRGESNTVLIYENASSLTLAIPSSFLKTMLARVDEVPGFKEHKVEDQKDLQSWLKEVTESGEDILAPPRVPMLKKKVKTEDKE